MFKRIKRFLTKKAGFNFIQAGLMLAIAAVAIYYGWNDHLKDPYYDNVTKTGGYMTTGGQE
ncbi:hypothetical protein [Desulforamulus reducens]|uniref:hypothetical protein n=1 Tax=Desulforamulus reducens TaxID=59610 RepID=UPI00030421BF|nr:hypothetical protein [Desulforamulus reducens]